MALASLGFESYVLKKDMQYIYLSIWHFPGVIFPYRQLQLLPGDAQKG